MSRNLAASIRARLKQHADATKQDFNLTLTHYGLERLLYRLWSRRMPPTTCSKARCCSRCGTTSLIGHTRDEDLLGLGPDDIDTTVLAFRGICQIAEENGITFDPASVKGAVIRKEAGVVTTHRLDFEINEAAAEAPGQASAEKTLDRSS